MHSNLKRKRSIYFKKGKKAVLMIPQKEGVSDAVEQVYDCPCAECPSLEFWGKVN